ncbi:protein AF-10-like isoform X1, partial [Dinothrombium tinctorium]
MVGGCCVCSDERGWTENPLVYCDGTYCNVAVHQACYGIVSVPTGPWFCRKCESQERQARVRCELCPSKDGALKRTDTGGWAHVVCSLYIPEVRFGNVTTMEPIILQLVPPERFHKTCYICEEAGKESKATVGACMQCNKSGCKQYFHVTCAQAAGLLCEEAGNFNDNVKYCGYCSYHYQKLKKDNSNIKSIPAFKPIPPENATPESSPEKQRSPNLSNNHQTSSALQTELNKPPKKKIIKSQSNLAAPNNISATTGTVNSSSSSSVGAVSGPVSSTGNFSRLMKSEIIGNDNAVVNSFPKMDNGTDSNCKSEKSEKKAKRRSSTNGATSSTPSPRPPTASPSPSVSFPNALPVSVLTSTAASSPNPTPSFTAMYGNLIANSSLSASKGDKVNNEKTVETSGDEISSIKRTKSATNNDKKKIRKTVGNALNKTTKVLKESGLEKKSRKKKESISKESSVIANGSFFSRLSYAFPLASIKKETDYRQAAIVTNGAVRQQNGYSSPSVESSSPLPSTSANTTPVDCQRLTPQSSTPQPSTPLNPVNFVSPSFPTTKAAQSSIPKDNSIDSNSQTLEQFLERQWTQGAQFLMEHGAQHFDVASLLSCLHQLRAENERLEERVRQLISRREHLLAVNARLSHPLNGAINNHTSVISQAPPAMPTFMSATNANSASVISSVNSNLPSSLPTTSSVNVAGFDNKGAANTQRLTQYQEMSLTSQMY